jgi:hypothetical protein
VYVAAFYDPIVGIWVHALWIKTCGQRHKGCANHNIALQFVRFIVCNLVRFLIQKCFLRPGLVHNGWLFMVYKRNLYNVAVACGFIVLGKRSKSEFLTPCGVRSYALSTLDRRC